jgi:hypothetical protein
MVAGGRAHARQLHDHGTRNRRDARRIVPSQYTKNVDNYAAVFEGSK